MPTIDFIASDFGPAATADVPDGGPLIDVCDQAHAPVPFSCRSASCGTCRVVVIRGAELLDPPRRDELEVLDILGAPPGHRLACQARLRPGPGAVTLRTIRADE